MKHKDEIRVRGPRRRECALELKTRAASGEEQVRTGNVFRVSLSSEAPVLSRDYYGDPFWEVLGHSDGEVNLTRLEAGAAIRDDHWGGQVGKVDNPELADQRLWADARFLQGGRGAELEGGILDGIIQNVSVGYEVERYTPAGFAEDGIPIYRALWTPFHMAVTPDPADYSVGFGRSANEGAEERTISVQTTGDQPTEGNRTMPNLNEQPGNSPAPSPGGDGGVQVLEARQRAVEEERTRARDIEDIAEANSIPRDEYRSWIDSGLTVQEAARKVREKRATRGAAQPGSEGIDRAVVNLSEKDAKQYSMLRAIRISAGMQGRGEGFGEKFDGVEREVHDEIERQVGPRQRRNGGVWLPLRLRDVSPQFVNRGAGPSKQRAMGAGVAGYGAETVFEQAGDLIDLLVPQTVLLNSGATLTTGLSSPVAYPKETGDVDGYWTSENPASPVSDSALAYGIVNLTPRTMMTTAPIPRQLLVQSSVDMESRVRLRMASKVARMLDAGGLHGTGTNGQVTGVFNTPGVLTSSSLATPSYSLLLEMVGKVAAVDADGLGTEGWLTTPEIASEFQATAKESGFPVYLWEGNRKNGTLCGYPARGSNQVSKTLGTGSDHGIVFGSFSQIEFGMFGAIEIIADPYTLATYGQIRLTMFQMADVIVKYPEAFCIGTGLSPA